MVIKIGDYVETNVCGLQGNITKIDRKQRKVRIHLSKNSPLKDLSSTAIVDIKSITKVYPKTIYVVDYLVNEGKENEDIIYDEYINLRSARKGYTEVINDKANKYARICKRLSSTYEIIEVIEEDY